MDEFTDAEYLDAGQSYFDGDRDVDIRCYSAKILTTRKRQFCCTCSKNHKKGTRMFAERAIVDGEWCSSYACCNSLAAFIRDEIIPRPSPTRVKKVRAEMKTTQEQRTAWRGLVDRVILTKNQELALLDDADLAASLSESAAEVEQLRAENERLQIKVKGGAVSCDSFAAEVCILRTQLAERDENIQRAQEEIAAAIEQVQVLEQERASLDEEMEIERAKWNRLVDATQADRSRLDAELSAACSRVQAMAEHFQPLADELERARKKFPRNRRLLAALTEELGELAKALLQRDPNWKREALQCACVAMRIYEEGDADFNDVTDEEAQP